MAIVISLYFFFFCLPIFFALKKCAVIRETLKKKKKWSYLRLNGSAGHGISFARWWGNKKKKKKVVKLLCVPYGLLYCRTAQVYYNIQIDIYLFFLQISRALFVSLSSHGNQSVAFFLPSIRGYQFSLFVFVFVFLFFFRKLREEKRIQIRWGERQMTVICPAAAVMRLLI